MANNNRAQHAAEAHEANELEAARARAAAQRAGLEASPPGSDPDGQAALHQAEHDLLAAHGMTDQDAQAARLRADREAANADADALVRQVHEERAARRAAPPAAVPDPGPQGVRQVRAADGTKQVFTEGEWQRAHPVPRLVHDPEYRKRIGLDPPTKPRRRRASTKEKTS